MITTPASTALLPTQAHLAGRSFLHGRVSRAVLISRRSQPLLSRNARRSRRAGARAPRAGLLDLFTGGGAPRGSAQKDELVEQLYDAVKDTDAGLRASPEERERIEELVSSTMTSPPLCACHVARWRQPTVFACTQLRLEWPQ